MASVDDNAQESAIEAVLNKRSASWRPTKTSWVQLVGLAAVLVAQLIGAVAVVTTMSNDIAAMKANIENLKSWQNNALSDIQNRLNVELKDRARNIAELTSRDKQVMDLRFSNIAEKLDDIREIQKAIRSRVESLERHNRINSNSMSWETLAAPVAPTKTSDD